MNNMKLNAVDGYIRRFDRAEHDNPLHIFKHYGVSGCIILFDSYSYYLGKLSILEKKYMVTGFLNFQTELDSN